jgi:3-mercaptopyruvate sulfurtransferase SseA
MIFGSRALLAFAIGLAAATSAAAQQAPVKDARISMEEFRALHQQGAVVVVDVRDAESYAEGHIPGALSVPLDLLQKYVPKLKALKKPIVTYCA